MSVNINEDRARAVVEDLARKLRVSSKSFVKVGELRAFLSSALGEEVARDAVDGLVTATDIADNSRTRIGTEGYKVNIEKARGGDLFSILMAAGKNRMSRDETCRAIADLGRQQVLANIAASRLDVAALPTNLYTLADILLSLHTAPDDRLATPRTVSGMIAGSTYLSDPPDLVRRFLRPTADGGLAILGLYKRDEAPSLVTDFILSPDEAAAEDILPPHPFPTARRRILRERQKRPGFPILSK
jgi:hypothetical protein